VTRPKRSARAALVAFLSGAALLGGRVQAQQTDTATAVPYAQRRNAILDDIKQSQKKLDQLRTERLQLESRVEQVAGKVAEQRTNTLLMSRESYALRQLDSLLTVAQDNLLAQRDRFLTLGDAVRRRAGAELVVTFRADSADPGQHIDSAQVKIDDGAGVARHYSVLANSALANGAIDELYRSNVLPASHQVTVIATINGLPPQAQSIRVDAAAGVVTYVQFAVRGGRLIQSSWTSRDAAAPR
jgi:hypothetical protein